MSLGAWFGAKVMVQALTSHPTVLHFIKLQYWCCFSQLYPFLSSSKLNELYLTKFRVKIDTVWFTETTKLKKENDEFCYFS